MCITSETCRANSVIKTALNNLHQAGPNKTQKFLSLLHLPEFIPFNKLVFLKNFPYILLTPTARFSYTVS